MNSIAYRPYPGFDREERIESDAMQWALMDILGDQLRIVDEFPEDVTHAFGRTKNRHSPGPSQVYPARHYDFLAYWEWPCFVANCGRNFEVLDLFEAVKRVDDIHAQDGDAFVKSTRSKEIATAVRRGTGLLEELDGMAYALADRGPCLMVQDFIPMTYEYRLFVVDGIIVTGAGAIERHTPADNRTQFDASVAVDRSCETIVEDRPDIVAKYLDFAAAIIPDCPVSTFVLDVAIVDGSPVIVEFNPLHLGQVGLFASQPSLLANALLKDLGLLEPLSLMPGTRTEIPIKGRP